MPMTKAIRALAKGKLSPSDKKAADKVLRDMYSVMAKAQQDLGDDPERGVKTVLGAWIKRLEKQIVRVHCKKCLSFILKKGCL